LLLVQISVLDLETGVLGEYPLTSTGKCDFENFYVACEIKIEKCDTFSSACYSSKTLSNYIPKKQDIAPDL